MEIWGKYTVNTIYIILVAHFSASGRNSKQESTIETYKSAAEKMHR